MDEILLKQLVRQVKILNFWVTFFGVLLITTLAIAGFMLYKIVTFVHSSEQKISDIQTKTSQTLDVQNELCRTSSVSNLFKTSDYCK